MPMVKLSNTSRRIRAKAIATIGGMILVHSGMDTPLASPAKATNCPTPSNINANKNRMRQNRTSQLIIKN